jgi:phage gpG-like protein
MSVTLDDARIQSFLKGLTKKKGEIAARKKAYVSGVSAFVFQDVMAHFEDEKGPDGKWAKWSKSYKEHMRKQGKAGNKILQDTGRLRQSFKPTNFRTNQKGIEWFNNALTKKGYPYAWAHNEGADKMPERKFMWLSDKAVDKISQFTLSFMMGEK